jgi:hypothetical protein
MLLADDNGIADLGPSTLLNGQKSSALEKAQAPVNRENLLSLAKVFRSCSGTLSGIPGYRKSGVTPIYQLSLFRIFSHHPPHFKPDYVFKETTLCLPAVSSSKYYSCVIRAADMSDPSSSTLKELLTTLRNFVDIVSSHPMTELQFIPEVRWKSTNPEVIY